MGLLYTKTYLDFPSNEWKQISNNPVVFEALEDNVVLDILDDNHRIRKLKFRKGGKMKYMESIGKYRLCWDENDLI